MWTLIPIGRNEVEIDDFVLLNGRPCQVTKIIDKEVHGTDLLNEENYSASTNTYVMFAKFEKQYKLLHITDATFELERTELPSLLSFGKTKVFPDDAYEVGTKFFIPIQAQDPIHKSLLEKNKSLLGKANLLLTVGKVPSQNPKTEYSELIYNYTILQN